MVWGGWGDAEKSYASMCVEFLLFGREKSQENHQNHFRVFNTCKPSPICFVPETLNPIFLENTKRRAPENDRDLSYQKLIWSHMMPFGVNSDPSFRAQKRRIRVRVSSFRTAETVAVRPLCVVRLHWPRRIPSNSFVFLFRCSKQTEDMAAIIIFGDVEVHSPIHSLTH